MNNSVLILILICGKTISTTKTDALLSDHVTDKDYYVYENYSYEDFCDVSDRKLTCKMEKKNEKNGNETAIKFKKQALDVVRLSINFSTCVKKDQLLVGIETDLKTLWFLDNFVTCVESKTFDNFTSLKVLNFYKTTLTFIDENVLTKKLGSHLKNLFLAFNNISSLSTSTFKFMSNLTELSLEGNSKVSDFVNNGIFVESLKNLKWLDLASCNITVLRDDIFANLTNLEFLSLASNPLISIPKAINKLPKLYSLFFDNSSIVSLYNNKEVFNKNLTILTFFGSKKLQNIESCAFCSFPNLWSITLTGSLNLSKLDKNAFGSLNDLPELNEVKMEQCNISSLPEMIFFRKIKLFLNDNPINKKGIFTVNVL